MSGMPPQGGPPPGWNPQPPPGFSAGYQAPGVAPMPGSTPLMPREHPQGTTILILGILGLVACQILGPVAWYMGSKALAEIDRQPAAYTNRGNVVAGKVLGIIGSALIALSIIGLIAAVLLFAVAGSSTSSTVGG